MPFPSPRDLPDLGIEPGSPALQADSLLSGPLRGPFFLGRPHGQASLSGLMRWWGHTPSQGHREPTGSALWEPPYMH